MHQKSREDNAAFGGGSFHGFDDDDDDDNDDDTRNRSDPFADVDDDDLDDDLDDDEPRHRDDRGGWWRGVVSRAAGAGAGADDDADSDDEEFGDFAMAEEERGGSIAGKDEETTPDRVLLKPLAVNPVKEAARGLSGLWPFGSRAETTAADKATPETEEEDSEVVVPRAAASAADKGGGGPVEAKEGIRRTSIEEVDDDEVIN